MRIGNSIGVSSRQFVKSGPVTDPYFANVVSLLHFNGNFTDVKGVSWTATGNAAATGDPLYGSNALIVDGVGDWVSTTGMPALGTSDFTAECWLNMTDITPVEPKVFVDCRNGPASNNGFVAWITTDGKLFVGYTSSGFTGTTILQDNTWHHIAITRQAGVFKSYVDGVLQGTQTPSSKNIAHGSWYIARAVDSTTFAVFPGRIDDFRVTKDVVRYTGNFTPPSAQFPDA